MFYIGATAGALFGGLIGADIATFAAIGFIAVLGGATNAPIAVSIMALEMFGPELVPYAAVACIIILCIIWFSRPLIGVRDTCAFKSAKFLIIQVIHLGHQHVSRTLVGKIRCILV